MNRNTRTIVVLLVAVVMAGLAAFGVYLAVQARPIREVEVARTQAVVATTLWLLVSLLFKFYVANFTDYEGSYGAVGGVIVLMLWFYVSGIAILTGAELNAEIEHASPYGKAPGQKSAQGKLLIGDG
jgi:YihY family inner membrane protein